MHIREMPVSFRIPGHCESSSWLEKPWAMWKISWIFSLHTHAYVTWDFPSDAYSPILGRANQSLWLHEQKFGL